MAATGANSTVSSPFIQTGTAATDIRMNVPTATWRHEQHHELPEDRGGGVLRQTHLGALVAGESLEQAIDHYRRCLAPVCSRNQGIINIRTEPKEGGPLHKT